MLGIGNGDFGGLSGFSQSMRCISYYTDTHETFADISNLSDQDWLEASPESIHNSPSANGRMQRIMLSAQNLEWS